MQWHQLGHMQTICTLLHTDSHTNTSSPNFYRPDAVPDAQPTVPKHWRCNNQKSRYTCIWCFTLHSCCMLLTVTFLNFLHWINCRLVNILYWSWLQVDMHQIQTDIQGGPKKPDCFSDLITLWRLVLGRRAVCQNFQNFMEKKVQNSHFNEFK